MWISGTVGSDDDRLEDGRHCLFSTGDHDYELPEFKSRDDYVMTGRRFNAAGDAFTFGDSEYADDTALPFCSRRDVAEQTPELMTHFARWGMEVHAGSAHVRNQGLQVRGSVLRRPSLHLHRPLYVRWRSRSTVTVITCVCVCRAPPCVL